MPEPFSPPPHLAAPLFPAAPTGILSPDWLELLYEVGRQFASSLELDDVLGKVLDLTIKAVGASYGSVFVLDEEGKVGRSILARRDLPPAVKHQTLATVMQQGFAGWVYRHRQAAILADATRDERWFVFSDDPLESRSVMVAPLIRRERVIGLLTVVHPEPNRFTRRQLELVEAIAIQAASAIENATLYTRIQNEHSTLLAVFAGVQDAIIVINMDDQVILANPAARRQLSLPKITVEQPFETFMREPAILAFVRAARQQTHALREMMLADGRVFDCALVLVPKVGRVLGMHDVTAFKRLDGLKSEFVAQVSHDLKAPLTIIHGYAELLSGAALPEAEHAYVENITRSVKRMQDLIDNLLDLGQIEQGLETEFEPLNLGLVTTAAAEHLRRLAEEKAIALDVDVPTELPLVRGAPVRLGQVVSNLVSNALKFTPEGGTVRVHIAQENGEVVVRVTDSGPGIPPGLRTKLFQKFSRLGQKRESEGHGLGLSIVKSVLEAHRGRVWVETPNASGSTFAFALPILQPPINADKRR